METEQTVRIAYLVLSLCRLVGSLALCRIVFRWLESKGKTVNFLGKVVILVIMYFVVSRLIIIGVLSATVAALNAMLANLSAAIA